MVLNTSSMPLMLALAGFLAVGTALQSPALAEDTAPGRYTMHQTDDGFLRLDTMTGAVSLCQKQDDKWNCVSVEGAAVADRDQIARLSKQNEELRAEIKRLDGMLGLNGKAPGGLPADPPRPGGRDHAFRLPSEKDVDQALDYFETMMRKLQERLKRLEKNQGQQGEDSKPL